LEIVGKRGTEAEREKEVLVEAVNHILITVTVIHT
jgi:hypothetical protein